MAFTFYFCFDQHTVPVGLQLTPCHPDVSMAPKRTCKSKGQDPPQKQAKQSPPTLPTSAVPCVPLVLLRALQVDHLTNQVLEGIYTNAKWLHRVECEGQNIKAHDSDFVDQHQFIANVRLNESEFIGVFRKAMEANEDDDDMKAFLDHSTCLSYGTNRIETLFRCISALIQEV